MKKILLVLFTLISLSAFAQTNGDIVDRLNATLGVRLPAEYEVKVKEFAANDTIMRTRSATAFTEQFIIEQFKNDWGIDRQNQLLFMWSKIYGGISQKKLYNWLDDDNKERSSEYKKCLKNISEFYEGYKKGFKEYMEQKSAEAKRQSAEAKRKKIDENITKIKGYINDIRDGLINLEALKKDGYLLKDTEKSIIDFKEREKEIIAKFDILNKSRQNNKAEDIDQHLSSSNQLVSESAKLVSAISKQRSAEAKRQSAEAKREAANLDSIGLKEAARFYSNYKKNPNLIRANELTYAKKVTTDVINSCKMLNIDYKAILRKELGDDKKVQELLKFYGVE